MKKIILEIIAALAVLMAVFAFLEYSFRDYKNGVDRIMEDFVSKRNNAEVLLVGNSHALPMYFNLSGDQGPNVACLTIGGLDLFWMQAMVKKQLKSMPRVKYLILNCDDELLGFNQSLSGMQYMNRILYPYADTMYGNKELDILLSKSNFFRSNRDIGYLFNKPANENMIIANAAGDGHFTDEECRVRALEISERRFQRKLFQENMEYLQSILNAAMARGLKIFILKMPRCECLKAAMNRENFDASRQLLDSIFLQEQVTLLDYSNDNSFHRQDFANPDHLKLAAAHQLMNRINEKIFSKYGERAIFLKPD